MGIPDSSGGDAPRESDYTWRKMLAVFWRIGILSFGGPAAQIAVMHRILVEEEQLLDEERFLGALSFCMLLPGPEAMQLATYSGWRLRGVSGGLLAGLLFVVPGALVVLGLAMLYMAVGHLPVMTALFLGIKGAVLIIVMEALLRVSKRALHSAVHWVIAGLTFVGIFFLSVPFPLIILASALAGFFMLGGRNAGNTRSGRSGGSASGTVRTVVIWLAVWWTPVFLLMALGGYEILVQIGNFFSRLAVVTFGGAYAVLAYLAQDVVTHKGWLSAGEMMDGLGLAETTPGPLILVTEFVGYVAAYRAGGVSMGIAGALVTLWVTFAPCFLWIFAGAPYIEQLTAQPRLKGALESITAAVVGVILNLSIWFGLHVLFTELPTVQLGPVKLLTPVWGSLDWRVLLVGAVSAIMLLWRRQSLMRTLGVAALMGLGFAAMGYFVQ
ncbi:MAG: chromate efflux transporter [Nitrospinae bacterium]|nr:chromate efflux transporter [Nitrospinota bacterium]